MFGKQESKSINGYMVGAGLPLKKVGEPWLMRNTKVWVCPTLEMAEKIVQASHQMFYNRSTIDVIRNNNNLDILWPETNCFWNNIYKVHGDVKTLSRDNGGMLYTRHPTQLTVVEHVKSVSYTDSENIFKEMSEKTLGQIMEKYSHTLKGK